MHPTPHAPRQAGIMFVPVLGVVIAILMLATLLSESSSGAVQRVGRRVEDVRLDAIADAAIDLTVQDLWSEYRYSLGSSTNTLKSFRAFLDGQGIAPRTVAAESGTEFDIFGHTKHEEPEWKDVLELSSLPRDKKDRPTLTGARVHSVGVLRQDAEGVTALRVRAVVSFGNDLTRRVSKEVERLYFAGGELFRGFGFALLANNVNCIMCHATIDSAARYYNTDPALRGTFDRVRVGTMESLKIRDGSADSVIAGTVYTRGPVMDKGGDLLGGLGGTSVDSRRFDADGKLVEDSGGNLTTTTFVNATGDPLPAGANLYMNYPRENSKQSDGDFPEEFPPVIPDLNNNRLVDADEYRDVADRAQGTLSGGNKVRVPLGATYAWAGLPASDHTPVLRGNVNGHLVAVGTAARPLVIDGRVTVNGDLAIAGVVRGAGEIIARNNTYILGPLTYQDANFGFANRTFGRATDGSENRLTLGAGGSILVGDFLRDKSGTGVITGGPDGAFNFTMSETTLFGQMEWVRTQPTVSEDGSANGAQIANPVYDPAHRPRYYVIRPESPVAIFNMEDTYFDVDTLTWLGKEHLGNWKDGPITYFPAGSPERNAAAVVSLSPENDWLTNAQIFAMWDASEAAHAGGPLPIDAFLYTNNAIFLLSRKNSEYRGQALINGGLVGADLGILVAGGLQLNYDDRHTDVIRLRENQKGELNLVRGVRLR